MFTRMVRALLRRATFANVAGLLALFVALGSSSVAAPARTVASGVAADVKRALKIGKQADKRSKQALAAAKKAAAKAAVPGPPGPPGATGQAGPAGPQGEQGLRGTAGEKGSGLGYAQIEYCPVGPPTGCEDFGDGPGWFSSDDTNSPGIDNTVNFVDPAENVGVFCYRGLPFTPHVVMAATMTVGDATAAGAKDVYFVQGRAGSAEHPLPECHFPGGTDNAKTAAVFVRDGTGTLTDPDTDVRVAVLFG